MIKNAVFYAVLLLLIFTHIHAAEKFNRTIFEKTIGVIKKEALFDLSDEEIYKGALKGVLKLLDEKVKGDKKKGRQVNVLLSPKQMKELRIDLEGEISGIGAVLTYKPEEGHKYPIVLDTIEGGGAKSAGLTAGDQILSIDGKKISQFKNFSEMIYAIRGPVNTKIKLTILRDGDLLNKKIRRKKIILPAVSMKPLTEKKALIKITNFSKKTYHQLLGILKNIKKKKISSLIVDLRVNMGGDLKEGIKVMKLFAKKDEILLNVLKTDQKKEVIKANEDGPFTKFKMVVIIGKSTMSMGEAFASFLKNKKEVLLIGQTTYGKGTVETLYDLKNGHKAKFTVGKLLDGKGSEWNNKGVEPHIKIPNNGKQKKDKDFELELARKYLLTD